MSQKVWPVGRNGLRQRGIGGPPRLGGAAGNEEADEHDNAANHVKLVARHVHARESHVRRPNLQRDQVVAERAEGQGHDSQKDHDRAVHRAEGIVQVRRNDPFGRCVAQDGGQQRPDQRHRLARMGDLPAHDQHQEEAEEQERKGGQTILEADDLMVGGEDVRSPELPFLVGRGMNWRMNKGV